MADRRKTEYLLREQVNRKEKVTMSKIVFVVSRKPYGNGLDPVIMKMEVVTELRDGYLLRRPGELSVGRIRTDEKSAFFETVEEANRYVARLSRRAILEVLRIKRKALSEGLEVV